MSAGFKASSAIVADAGAGKTVPWPNGHHAGDYAFLVDTKLDTVTMAATTLTTAAGFTLLGSVEDTQGTIFVRTTVWYCVATSSAMTSPVVATGGTGHSSVATMHTYSGALNAAPDFVVTSHGPGPGSGTTTNVTLTGSNSSVANDLVVAIAAMTANSATMSIGSWADASLINLTEYADQSISTPTNLICIGTASGLLRANAASGSVTATFTTSSSDPFTAWNGFMIGLKPAANVAVTKDATSGKYTPLTEAEWWSLLDGTGYTTPNVLWMPGAPASGNVPDLIGNFLGTVNTSAGNYQNAVPGWATKGMLLSDGSTHKVVNQDASLPDLTTQSMMAFSWTGYTVSVSVERSVVTLGGGFGHQCAHDLINSTPAHFSLALGGGTGGGTNTNGTLSAASGVHPTIIQENKSASLAILQNESETLSHATTAAETGKGLALGGDNITWWFSGGTLHILTAAWFAAKAELDATGRATLLDRVTNGPAVASIAVTPTPVALSPAGATQQLTATATLVDSSTANITATATWSSSNPSIATVSASGLVTAVAAGVANISCTYTSLNAATATSNSVPVTVTTGVTYSAISVTPAVGQCFIGGTKQFTAIGTITGGGTADVTSAAAWSSSNPAAATVAAGLASGLSIGGTIITASIGGHSDTSMLTVLVNAGAAGDLADQQAAMFGEDIWYDVSHPDDQGFADLIVDAGGDWQDVTGIEALRQSLLRRMITSPGEWQTVPEYGVGARQYIKAPMTPSTIAELESRIRSQYLRDDRVESIDSITITPLTGNLPGIYVLVNVIPKGRLRQDVTLPVAITIT